MGPGGAGWRRHGRSSEEVSARCDRFPRGQPQGVGKVTLEGKRERGTAAPPRSPASFLGPLNSGCTPKKHGEKRGLDAAEAG